MFGSVAGGSVCRLCGGGSSHTGPCDYRSDYDVGFDDGSKVEEMHVSVPMLDPNVYGEEIALMSSLNNLVERSKATKEDRARAVEWLYKKHALNVIDTSA